MATVWIAEDRVVGDIVVIKRPSRTTPAALERARREGVALRLLRFPGVVSWRDDGVDEQGPFLVTERIHGSPFPGGASAADRVEVVGVRLLEVLSRVHAAGIVHRDLKPANVLVDPSDRPWVLDFGIARGRALGSTLTEDGSAIGTPTYMAPEQLIGSRVDARADLYAVGLMLYEALAGVVPFDGPDALLGRVWSDPPPIADVAPSTPPALARLVDALCARQPGHRPPSAASALGLLGRSPPQPRVVFLGPTSGVEALVEAGRAGRALDVRSEPGSGRTRHLEEASAILAREGRSIVWAVAGQRPLSSIRATFGLSADLDPSTCRDLLREKLGSGLVLIVDPPSVLDRWSREMLEGLDGAILGLGSAAIETARLAEPDLRHAFHGPDRVLHLREDGARELIRQSAGLPSRVVAAIATWVEAGLALLEDGRLRLRAADLTRIADLESVSSGITALGMPTDAVDRELLAWVTLGAGKLTTADLGGLTQLAPWQIDFKIQELEAMGFLDLSGGAPLARASPLAPFVDWSEAERAAAHRAIAARMPAGTDDRLRHLVQADDTLAVLAEGLSRAQDLSARGRFLEACHVLTTVHTSIRGRVAPLDEARVLEAWVLVAYAAEDARPRDAVVDAVRRSDVARPGASTVLDLAEASVALARRHFSVAEGLLADLPALEDPSLELARVTMLVESRTRGRPHEARDELERWREWGSATLERRGRWLGWCGLVAYRQADFEAAARHHAEAARHRETAYGRLVARVNEAMALLEIPDLERAEAGARQAVREAADLRLSGLELRAWTVLRGARYRRGEADAVDAELVAACEQGDARAAAAHHLFMEATIAWRRGDTVPADSLLAAARRRYDGFLPGTTACDALRTLLTSDGRDEDWATRIQALPDPRLALQLWAALRLAGRACGAPPAFRPPAGSDPDVRWEILSAREVNTALRAHLEEDMASQSQLGEGVYTVRLTNGAGAIIAVVSVKRPDPTTNPAPSPPYGREYWDLVTAVGGGETNYATFDNSVLAGGGTKALYFTKVAAWTYAADAHPPLPSPDAPTPANGTTLRRWITFGVAMATYP